MYEELLKWAAIVELPIFAALFRITTKHRKDYSQEVAICKDALADFKLYAARSYVSAAYLKDVETRLSNHLLRIEKKLDTMGGHK